MSITGSSTPVYSGTAFNMTCTAIVTKSLELPVTVTMVWKKFSLCGNNWKPIFNFPATEASPNSFQSTVELYPVCSSDHGTYSCTATVVTEFNYSTTNVAHFSLSVTSKFYLLSI